MPNLCSSFFTDKVHDTCHFYQKILKTLALPIHKLDNIYYYIKQSDKYIAINRQMLFNYSHIFTFKKLSNENDTSKIIFNPLNDNKESCSMLILEDKINIILSKYIHIIVINFLKIKADLIKCPSIEEKLKELPVCSNTTLVKWDNIYKVISATYFSKNLIDFSFKFNKNNNSIKMNFIYPLYNILESTKHNVVGINLEESEIELFTKIYKLFIIDILNETFKESFDIPSTSNKHPYLYALLKFYLDTEQEMSRIYKPFFLHLVRRNNKKDSGNIREDDIVHLNKFTIYQLSEDLDKLDKELYKQELQIRKESEPNWLLLKDDEMGKNKQQPAVIEDNNIGQIIDSFGNFLGSYNIKQYTNAINRLNTDMLVQERKDNYQIWKNDQEWKDIFYLQNLVLNILKTDGGALWYDSRIKKYCFRSKLNGSISEIDSKELGDLLTRAFKEKIIHFNINNKYNLLDYAMEVVVVSKLKGINNQKLSINEKSNDIIKILLFENEIKTIDDDVFNVNINDEFFKNNNDFFYTQNRFVPNDYLIKRHQQNQLIATASTEQTFIEKFIYYLVKENQELSDYIINWLAYYFKNLKKSKTALVLLGDQRVTKDIFWNIIIKEIFTKHYCITIDDKECDTTLVSDIAKDKLFFHIDDITDADTKFDDETLALIIKDLLIKPSVTTDTNEEIYIHGQILITAKNPAPYLKKVLSKCTVIEVNDIDIIIEKLNLEDEAELEDKILEDLNSFTDKLLQYNVTNDTALNKIDTEARQTLKGDKSPNIDKEDIDNKIDVFIQAIKNKDLGYFEKVNGTKDKNSNDIYEQLKYAFNQDDGYFIGQDMYLYYNAIYKQHFKTNKPLMDKLKVKDDMFNQEVKTLRILNKDQNEQVLFQAYKTSKETNNKELYKIIDYTMAKDITIPYGATIISSQENLRKYSCEDIDECIKRTKEYKEKK